MLGHSGRLWRTINTGLKANPPSVECGGGHTSYDILWLQAAFLPTQKSFRACIFLPETTEGFKPPAVRLLSTNHHSLPEGVGKGYVDAEVTFCLVNAVHTQPQAS